MIAPMEQEVLDLLTRLAIAFERHEHPPVFTVEEAEIHWAGIDAVHCKNLFLRNKKGNRHYLVIAPCSRQVDLRRLNRLLEEDRLSFASPERMDRYLGVTPGSVSPFGLIHDRQREVQVILDAELQQAERVGFHPNINTATLVISFADFVRFLKHCGQNPRVLQL